MNICKCAAPLAKLVITLFLIAPPLSAQHKRPAAPKAPPPAQPAQAATTFETLLAADSYKIYGEVRGVGQLLRSPGVSDILDPAMKLSGPPKEFKALVKWLNSQADALTTSRLMFAGWPSRPKLPPVLVVIEFPSVEDAQKFEPNLKEFLPKLFPPPTPESPPSHANNKNENPETKPRDVQPPPYILKQSGPLVFISAAPFTLKALRPSGSKLLTEDPNFRQVHDRFNSESIFLYFDIASVEKEDRERIQRMKDEEQPEKKRLETEAANSPKSDERAEPATPEMTPEESPPPAPMVVDPAEAKASEKVAGLPQGHATLGVVNQEGATQAVSGGSASMALDMLSNTFLFGRPRWPEAIGVAVAFDADSYVVRALLVNRPEAKGTVFPFTPQLVSGPALTPEASSVLPADTELLVTLSLDYPLIYEGLQKAMARESERRDTKQIIKGNQPESPFAAYEAKLGIKIKEDLLPLLGNEIALSIPVKMLGMGIPQPASSSSSSRPREEVADEKTAAPSGPNVVIAISVKDREAVRTLIPKVIETMGFKGANLLAQTEKRDDTELVSYANAISYAFIGNFLVVSPDAKAVRHVFDSYLNHQTLASDSAFKNFTRWQPRQLLGQAYLSPELGEAYSALTKDTSLMNDSLRDFLSRLSPAAEAVTYALSNEGLGPLHELHVPKNYVMMMIAGIATQSSQPPIVQNEAIAKSALRMLASAEATYQSTSGNGSFGSVDQLVEQGLMQKDLLQKYGYRVDLNVAGQKFEATAVPMEYGKTGKMSFFVDQSGVLRGADQGGSPATVADKPVQ